MSRQVNKTAIGAFVIGAVMLVLAGIFIFGSGRLLSERVRFVMFFEGSVSGLSNGAPVVFRGVQVGRVTRVQMHFDSEKMNIQIPVIVEIEPDRVVWMGDGPRLGVEKYMALMVDRGLRAQLQLQSVVTGQLMVELDFHDGKPAHLRAAAFPYPEIPTVPAKWEELTRTIEKIPFDELITKLTLSIEGIERTVNRPEIVESIRNLNHALKDARTFFQNIDARTAPLAEGIGKTITGVDQLVKNTDQRMDRLATGVEATVGDVRNLLAALDGRFETLSRDITATSAAARNALRQVEGTLSTVDGLVADNSGIPHELSETLRELAAAARSVRMLADYLEQYPDALIRGKKLSGGNP